MSNVECEMSNQKLNFNETLNTKKENMRTEIEKRLINLAININELCKLFDKSFLSKHMTTQIVRSSTSAALNYGEAQGAESKRDFIHKSSIVIKELRETKISLHIVKSLIDVDERNLYPQCLDECDQLVAIFYKTIMTAKQKR